MTSINAMAGREVHVVSLRPVRREHVTNRTKMHTCIFTPFSITVRHATRAHGQGREAICLSIECQVEHVLAFFVESLENSSALDLHIINSRCEYTL
jgi:hypothetical protein